jgi:hypothetical protein
VTTFRPAGALQPILVILLAGACSHVIHPAAVRPGFSMQVATAVEVSRHEPEPVLTAPLTAFDPFHTALVVGQLTLSYGWRVSDDAGLQVAASFGPNAAPMLDGYAQLVASPFDAGLGITLSSNGRKPPDGALPGVYAMAGKEWEAGPGRAMRVDLGFRGEAVHSRYTGWEHGYGPFALITLIASSRYAVGVWGDGRWFSRPVLRSMCQDNCEPRDLVRGAAAAGLAVAFTP